MFVIDALIYFLSFIHPILILVSVVIIGCGLQFYAAVVVATGAVRWGRHHSNAIRNAFRLFNKQALIDLVTFCVIIHHWGMVAAAIWWEPTPIVGIVFWGWMLVSLCSQFYMSTWAYKRNPTHPLFN
jgi:hypothetical protein